MDNPAMEIWASLAMFKLNSLNLIFPPLFKAWLCWQLTYTQNKNKTKTYLDFLISKMRLIQILLDR